MMRDTRIVIKFKECVTFKLLFITTITPSQASLSLFLVLGNFYIIIILHYILLVYSITGVRHVNVQLVIPPTHLINITHIGSGGSSEGED